MSDAVLVIMVLSALSAWSWNLFHRRRWRLPPGPKPLPVIGNVLQVTSGYEWLQYARLSKEYGTCPLAPNDSSALNVGIGPIVYLNFLGKRVFVLNSQQTAYDILEKNMNVYSGRPQNMVMASDL